MAREIELKGAARANEIVKCGQDPIYFMKHYVTITHPKKQLIKFETFPFQDDCIRAFQENRFNIILKSRQLGLSTVTAAYCLWMALFQKQKNILVIATKLDVAKNFLRKVRQMFESLPRWLVMPVVKEESVRYLVFSNGSRITAIPTGADAGRSEAVSLLVVDEAAHIDNFDYHWMGLYSTVTHGGSAILLSTPKGVGNKFHELWMGCDQERHENAFHGIKLPWTVHPEHDEAWFQEESKNLDKRGIAQEFLCNFQASGDTYISPPELQWLEDMKVPPVAKFELDPNVWIWKFPVPGHKYLISADVARGDGDDYSAFHILDTDNREIVAEYQGKKPPDRLGELLVEIGSRYNNAMICNEKNSFGLATSYKLRDLKYPALYYEKLAKGGPYQVYTEADVEGETPGFTTSSKNRTQILAALESAIRNKTLKIYSSRFSEEAKTLIWTGTKAQAQKGYNDDLAMSLAILCWIFDLGNATGTVDNTAMNTAMLKAWSKTSTTYTSIGYAQMQNRQNSPTGVNPAATGFGRSSMTNNYKVPGLQTPEGFISVPPEKVPAGVDRQQLEDALNIYNIYNWLTK